MPATKEKRKNAKQHEASDKHVALDLEMLKSLSMNEMNLQVDESGSTASKHIATVQTKKCEKLDRTHGLRVLDGYLRKTGLKMHDYVKYDANTHECKFQNISICVKLNK